jgi:hypothetical protein
MDRWLTAAFLFSMIVVAQAVRAAASFPTLRGARLGDGPT